MKSIKKILVGLISLGILLPNICLIVFASNSTATTYEHLIEILKNPNKYAVMLETVNPNINCGNIVSATYQLRGGGTATYYDVIGYNLPVDDIVDTEIVEKLRIGDRQRFATNIISIAYATAEATDKYKKEFGSMAGGVTTVTVKELYKNLEDKGMGSSLLVGMASDFNPNLAKANILYRGLSGNVNIITGLLSILLVAFIGITTAVDIAYIAIPGVQLALGPPNFSHKGHSGGSEINYYTFGKLVSHAAKEAVCEGELTASHNGGNGKSTFVCYLRRRWIELCVLGICLLYLITGNIFAFVAGILDLVSGFLGF